MKRSGTQFKSISYSVETSRVQHCNLPYKSLCNVKCCRQSHLHETDASETELFIGLSDSQIAHLIESAKTFRTRGLRARFIKEATAFLAQQVTPGPERARFISNGQLTLAIDHAMRRLGAAA